MSDIYPITLTRYNDLDEAGLIDANQTYQIYSTEEDIAQELIRTRKALDEKRPVLSLDDADKNNQTTESQIKKIKKDVK